MSTGNTKTDIAVALTKGAVGAIPLVGSLAAEVVGAVIPNQRLDRIAKLVESLQAKVASMDEDRVRRAFTEPGFVDLLEDGFFQAARALSEERIEYIASLLKEGISEERRDYIELKKLLYLLNELNDIEVIVLRSYDDSPGGGSRSEFRRKHKDILASPGAHLGSSQDQVDDQTLYTAYRMHLARLGLIRPRFKKPRKGELPQFDIKTGMIETSGYDISPLGRLLIKHIEAGSQPPVPDGRNSDTDSADADE